MNSFFQKINIFKHNRLLVVSLIFFVVFSYVVRTAFATPLYDYTNTVTDPSCEPTNVSCTVSNFPDDTGYSGKFLTTNGSGTLTWASTMAIGGAVTSGTAGSVYFGGTAGALAQDNTNFFWDDSNNRLGINDNTPSVSLDVTGTINASTQYNAGGYFFAAQDVSISSVRVGKDSGNDTMSGNANTLIGNNAGNDLTSGYMNLFAGKNAGQVTTSGYANIFLGPYAGSSNIEGDTNVFVGAQSGELNSSGDGNVYLGYYAANNSTIGKYNVSIGRYANRYGVSGQANVFIGSQSGENIDDDFQVAIGAEALHGATNATAATNTVVGYSSGYAVTSGSSNAFLGFRTGTATTTGSENAYLGYVAGELNTTGGNNVFIGSYAGASNTTGGTNTYIGSYAGYTDIANGVSTSNALTNATAIGYKAQVGASSSLVLGGMGTNAVNVGIGDITPDYRLDIEYSSDGVVASFDDTDSGSCTVDPGDGDFSCSSDERLKKNISTIESSLGIVNSLRPVRYNWNSDENTESSNIGFIAQEVDRLLPELVTIYKDGYLGLNYAGFTPVLTKAIQELDLKIIGIENFADQTFISRLREWFGSVTNGLEKLYAGKVETYEIQTQKICVGSRCINESQFIELLDKNGIGEIEVVPPQDQQVVPSEGDNTLPQNNEAVNPLDVVGGGSPVSLSAEGAPQVGEASATDSVVVVDSTEPSLPTEIFQETVE